MDMFICHIKAPHHPTFNSWPDPAKDRGICEKNFNRIPENYNGITQQHGKFVSYYELYFCGFQKNNRSVNIPKKPLDPILKKKTNSSSQCILLIQQPLKNQCHPDMLEAHYSYLGEVMRWRSKVERAVRLERRWWIRFHLVCSIDGTRTVFLLCLCHPQHNWGPRAFRLDCSTNYKHQ